MTATTSCHGQPWSLYQHLPSHSSNATREPRSIKQWWQQSTNKIKNKSQDKKYLHFFGTCSYLQLASRYWWWGHILRHFFVLKGHRGLPRHTASCSIHQLLQNTTNQPYQHKRDENIVGHIQVELQFNPVLKHTTWEWDVNRLDNEFGKVYYSKKESMSNRIWNNMEEKTTKEKSSLRWYLRQLPHKIYKEQVWAILIIRQVPPKTSYQKHIRNAQQLIYTSHIAFYFAKVLPTITHTIQ